jgi:hypothetical protein
VHEYELALLVADEAVELLGEGGYEGPEDLVGGVLHPSGLVVQVVRQELGEEVPTYRQGHATRHRHHHVDRRLAHVPDVVEAEHRVGLELRAEGGEAQYRADVSRV